jgi:periplasmic divalent cation tolerance protein
MKIPEHIIVHVSVDSYENAIHISRIIVSEKLAACCSIIPGVTSIYTWKDSIQESRELILMIKTHKSKFSELKERIKELHTYETPEIISINIQDASKEYIQWIDECLNT